MRSVSYLLCGFLLFVSAASGPVYAQDAQAPGAPPPGNLVRTFGGVGVEMGAGSGMDVMIPGLFGQLGIGFELVPDVIGFDVFLEAGLGWLPLKGIGAHGGAQADIRIWDTLSLGAGGGYTLQAGNNDIAAGYIRFSCSVLLWKTCCTAWKIGGYFDSILSDTAGPGFGLKVSYTWFW